jgi:hypothetical protein
MDVEPNHTTTRSLAFFKSSIFSGYRHGIFVLVAAGWCRYENCRVTFVRKVYIKY